MCREYRHDGQVVEERLYFYGRQSFRGQAINRGGDCFIHRFVMLLSAAGSFPHYPHSFFFLRQVDQLEVGIERFDDRACLADRQVVDNPKQMATRSRVTRAASLRQPANSLDQIVDRWPFLLVDRLAEQVTQQVDLFA
jgi:hypothetical protein